MQIMLSRHARTKMIERAVTVKELDQLVLHPEVTYRSEYHQGKHTPNTWVHQAGKLAAVVRHDTDRYFVLTILLRSKQRWTDEDARAR